MPCGEAGDQRQAGGRGQSGRTPRRPGSPVRTSASTRPRSADSAPPLRRTTRSSAPTGLSPAATARASSSATVGNSARIRRSRCLDLAGQVGVAGEHPEHERDQAQEQPRPAAPTRVGERRGARRTPRRRAKADQPPDAPARPGTRARSCRGRRARGGGVPTRRRRAPARPCRPPSAAPARRRPAAAEVGEDDATRSAGRAADLRQVADVGQHPQRELGAPQRQHAGRAPAAARRRATAPSERAPRGQASRQDPPLGRAAGRSASSAGRRPTQAPRRRRAPARPPGEA